MTLIYSRQASTFNGTDEHVSMGNVLDKERTDSFSAWAWVKTADVVGTILGKRDGTGDLRGWEMAVIGESLGVVLQNAVGNRIEVTTLSDVTNSEWHLLAFSYDGSSTAAGVVLFVDGLPVPTSTVEDTLSATISQSESFAIGARDGGTPTNFLAATLDDPGVASKALSLDEILEIWNGGTPKSPEELSFFTPFIRVGGDAWRAGDSPDVPATWFSIPGNNDGTTTGFLAANFTNDVPFRSFLNVMSLMFDGVGDFVALASPGAHDFANGSSFSFSFWFKSGGTAGDVVFVSKIDTTTPFEGYQIHMDAPGSIHVKLVNSDDPVGTDVVAVKTTAVGFDDGFWHHVVVTYDGSSTPGGIHIWVDFTDEALTTLEADALAGSLSSAAPLRFGATPAGADFLPGHMTQMAVFDTVLFAPDVAELFIDGPTDLAKFSVWPGVVGWWHFGECDTAATTFDRSLKLAGIGGADGTLTGVPVVDNDVPPSFKQQLTGLALELDGTTQYVDVGDLAAWSFERTDTFSFECWFKVTGSVTTTEVLMAKADGTSPFQGIWLFLTSPGEIAWNLINTNTTNELRVDTTETFDDGEWHHLVATYDGTSTAAGAKVYVDGYQRTTTTVNDTLSATILHPVALQFGATDGATFPFNGFLADVAVYSVELTAAEVAEHKGLSGPIDRSTASTEAALVGWWPIGNGDSGSVTKVCDYAHNSHNHGTLSGTDAGYGQYTEDAPAVDWKSAYRGHSQKFITQANMNGLAAQQVLGLGTSYENTLLPFGASIGDAASGLRSTMQNFITQAANGLAGQQVLGLGNSYIDPRMPPNLTIFGSPLPFTAYRGGQQKFLTQIPTPNQAIPHFQGVSYEPQGTSGIKQILGPDDPTLRMPPPLTESNVIGLPAGGGPGVTDFFKMRGVDSGTGTYTTWVVTDDPDPNGTKATPGNTTPALVGSIVASSGIVADSWQAS